ncbi:MAG TPA: hypothetical protein V6C76_10880 [Drouetiella sp.]
MTKKDEEIQRKLAELESAVLKESTTHSDQQHLTTPPTSSDVSALDKLQKKHLPPAEVPIKNDLLYFGGIALIFTGLFMVFNHVRVGTGIMGALGFGGGGFGLLFIPLMVGIGWLVYDSKSPIPKFIIAGSCAIVIFAILSSLTMFFPGLTFLGMICMLLPFAVGGAMLLKGMGGPKGIEQKMKKPE